MNSLQVIAKHLVPCLNQFSFLPFLHLKSFYTESLIKLHTSRAPTPDIMNAPHQFNGLMYLTTSQKSHDSQV